MDARFGSARMAGTAVEIIWHKTNPMPESVRIGQRKRTNRFSC